MKVDITRKGFRRLDYFGDKSLGESPEMEIGLRAEEVILDEFRLGEIDLEEAIVNIRETAPNIPEDLIRDRLGSLFAGGYLYKIL